MFLGTSGQTVQRWFFDSISDDGDPDRNLSCSNPPPLEHPERPSLGAAAHPTCRQRHDHRARDEQQASAPHHRLLALQTNDDLKVSS